MTNLTRQRTGPLTTNLAAVLAVLAVSPLARARPGRRWRSGRPLATLLVSLGTLLATVTGTAGAYAGPPEPSISADGRYLAFSSRANDLSAEDNDPVVDIFVRDLQTNTTTLVSRATGAAGAPAAGPPTDLMSEAPSISADGRFVAFMSVAHNLSAEDNDLANIFVRDLQTNTTTLVSRASGASGAAANGGSINPAISADGRFVAFDSDAHNLSAEDNDVVRDIYVRNLQTNSTTLVSRASGAAGATADRPTFPSEAPSISADGRFVAFSSQADNLSAEDNDFVGNACFPGPYGTWCVEVRVADIFVRDLQASTTTFASRASGVTGAAADYGGVLNEVWSESVSREPSISADGGFVALSSAADNLSAEDNDVVRDIYVRDLQTNSTTLVSRASGAAGEPFQDHSAQPSISADGRFVAFSSRRCGEGEIKGTDIYVRDLQSESTTWVSQDPNTGVCPTPDTTAPTTKITKHPKNKVVAKAAKVKVKFAFKSSEVGSSFKCKRDKKAWKACTSPKPYKVRTGKHKFKVRAIDAAGNVDPTPATDKFKVVG